MEIKKFLETNDNENMITQYLWDTTKAALRGKYTEYTPTSRNKKKYRIDNLTLNLKQLEKEQKTTKIRRRK